MIENHEQSIAEAFYEFIRTEATREQTAELISRLLSDQETTRLTRSIAIRMAMIFSAEEGHS